jgi:hypothetical protein
MMGLMAFCVVIAAIVATALMVIQFGFTSPFTYYAIAGFCYFMFAIFQQAIQP